MIALPKEYITLVKLIKDDLSYEIKEESELLQTIDNFRFWMFVKSKDNIIENYYSRVLNTYEPNHCWVMCYRTTDISTKGIHAEEACSWEGILGYIGFPEIQRYLRLKGYKTNYTHKGRLETYLTWREWVFITENDPLIPLYYQVKAIEDIIKWIKQNIKKKDN